ncbi:MAG: fimbrillin family protein [Muribaculaceae bacterium]|nr:fimbrillin family protein [Muribaculaceae bacterium]
MNDKIIKYGLTSALAASMLSSCSQEDMQVSGLPGADDAIVFVTAFPGVETRSNDNTVIGSLNEGFYVTAFAPEDETTIGTENKLNEYFANQLVTKTLGMVNAFGSDMCRWPANTGTKSGTLKFFAFYPSVETLRQRAGEDGNSSYFELLNNSTSSSYSYLMTKFKINKDISKHVDFVTATSEGNKTANLYSGVNLNFEHQLSRINIRAWGAPTNYEVEIAGVRLGNVNTEGSCNFSGTWTSTSKGIVEYIYNEGDKVISIGKGQYNKVDSATSIMGNGGAALIIPDTYSTKWNTSEENGFYYSVLLRIKDKNGSLLYPYTEEEEMTTDGTDNKEVVYLSFDKSSDLVKKRLYKKDGNYYTSDNFSSDSLYEKRDDEEVRNYRWAAVPSTAAWVVGYEYIIRLGYSTGVGVKDPADSHPGEPIIVGISPTVVVEGFEVVDDEDLSDRFDIIK